MLTGFMYSLLLFDVLPREYCLLASAVAGLRVPVRPDVAWNSAGGAEKAGYNGTERMVVVLSVVFGIY